MSTQKQVLRYQALKNMEDELDNLESQNEEIENANSTNGETDEVDVEAIKKENADLKKTNQELYERERKAKGFVRGTDGKWIKPELRETKEEKTETKSETKSENLSLKDIRALQDVHDDDVDQITDYAKFKGVSVAEAKKLPEMQSLLRTKEEERKTAQATNTGGGRKGSSKVTGEDLIERAMSGQLPESDEDIVKLAEARLAQKIANIQK